VKECVKYVREGGACKQGPPRGTLLPLCPCPPSRPPPLPPLAPPALAPHSPSPPHSPDSPHALADLHVRRQGGIYALSCVVTLCYDLSRFVMLCHVASRHMAVYEGVRRVCGGWAARRWLGMDCLRSALCGAWHCQQHVSHVCGWIPPSAHSHRAWSCWSPLAGGGRCGSGAAPDGPPAAEAPSLAGVQLPLPATPAAALGAPTLWPL
jgi:hypothetical protein